MQTLLTGVLTVAYRHRIVTLALLLGLGVASYIFWPLSDAYTEERAILSTPILDRNGDLLYEVRPEGRGIPVQLSEMAPYVPDILIAVEDRQFYTHHGISVRAMARALRDNLFSGEIVSGGSTLSMQVARMLKGHTSRSVFHKVAEMALALRLEAHLSKDELLTLWLNRAYFGNQTYGIEAAAHVYFGKSARDITRSEAAYLIGLPQNPVGYDPYRFPRHALHRHGRVLHALHETERITPEELDKLQDVPLVIQPRDYTYKAPHLVAYLRQEAERVPHIQTTLDAQLQAEVEDLTRAHLKRLNSEHITNAAAVVLDNTTGEVLAYMGSADFWNAVHGGQNDGVRMLRQPGSALKPFTYALALASSRYTPASILPDIETQIPEAGGAFSPQNYDEIYHGPVPFREALANSYNVPAIRLAREIGPEPLLRSFQHIGFVSLNKSAEHYGVGLTLGNGEVRLIELAAAYAALAREGRPLSPVYRLNDTLIEQNRTTQEQVIQPEVAALITDILNDPEARATAFGRYGPLELPFPCAVKTGTSKDYRDNWTVGYTPRHTVAVWVGNFDGTPMQKVSGVSGAGPLFKSIMLHLGASGDFALPETIESHRICPISGLRPSRVCPLQRQELFLKNTAPSDTCTTHRLHVIDTRTHALADDATPARFKRSQLYTLHEALFHPWMRDNNVPFPPDSSLSSSIPDHVVPQIAYPVSGMIFQIDPILRREYQRITFDGILPEGLSQAEWWINDAPQARNTVSHTWTLEPGAHTITLKAQKKDGSWVASRPAIITVVD